jgi:biopolymer transport protein ExbD
MNFRRAVRREEPEINFIPLIDVLLVILIFLMVSTTYARFSELQVNLPSATGEPGGERIAEMVVGVAADGRYTIDKRAVPYRDPASFSQELQRVAADKKDVIVIIYADAGASHQAVVNVLEAARLAGLPKVTFAAQSGAAASR